MMKHKHLPFEVILSATEGDPEAIETVMSFYDGYISKLCFLKGFILYGDTRRLYKKKSFQFQVE